MAKSKRTAKQQPDPHDDGGPVLYVRMPPKLQAAFAAYINSDPLQSSRQSAGLVALTEFLERKGYWPPKE